MIVNTEYADISLSSSRCEPWSLRPRPKVNIPASGARGHRFPMCGEFPAILPISPSTSNPEVISSPLGSVPALTPLYCLVYFWMVGITKPLSGS